MSAWENNVRRVIPYTPGEQPNRPNMIKLNTNENPYPPAPGVEHALQGISQDAMRRYPDPGAEVLIKAIAEYYQVQENQVFAGVGSDDVLAISFLTFFNSGRPILFPDITYSFYDVWANLYRIPFECLPLDQNFEINPKDYDRKCGGIVIANPNAPTGTELKLSEIEEIVAKKPEIIVIVDEAYIDFGGTSALSLLPKYDNLLVVQTFSKSRSLAGMRIGYAIGDSRLIQYLNDVKYSFNSYTMNVAALAAGTAAIKDDIYFTETRRKIIDTREWAKAELHRLGFEFSDSKANFIFAAHGEIPAKKIYEALKHADIYVRYFEKPRIDNYLRITIGTESEMKELIGFLEEYIRTYSE